MLQEQVSTLTTFVAKLSSAAFCFHDLTSQTLSPHPTPPIHSALFFVWRASPRGCFVKAGEIDLPEDGVLLLDNYGANFHGTVFTGTSQCSSFLRATPEDILFASVCVDSVCFSVQRPVSLLGWLKVCYCSVASDWFLFMRRSLHCPCCMVLLMYRRCVCLCSTVESPICCTMP